MPLPMAQLMHTLLAAQVREQQNTEMMRQRAIAQELQMSDRVGASGRRAQESLAQPIQRQMGMELQADQASAAERRRQEDMGVAEDKQKFAEMMAMENLGLSDAKQGLQQDQFGETQAQNELDQTYRYDRMDLERELARMRAGSAEKRARTMASGRERNRETGDFKAMAATVNAQYDDYIRPYQEIVDDLMRRKEHAGARQKIVEINAARRDELDRLERAYPQISRGAVQPRGAAGGRTIEEILAGPPIPGGLVESDNPALDWIKGQD